MATSPQLKHPAPYNIERETLESSSKSIWIRESPNHTPFVAMYTPPPPPPSTSPTSPPRPPCPCCTKPPNLNPFEAGLSLLTTDVASYNGLKDDVFYDTLDRNYNAVEHASETTHTHCNQSTIYLTASNHAFSVLLTQEVVTHFRKINKAIEEGKEEVLLPQFMRDPATHKGMTIYIDKNIQTVLEGDGSSWNFAPLQKFWQSGRM